MPRDKTYKDMMREAEFEVQAIRRSLSRLCRIFEEAEKLWDNLVFLKTHEERQEETD